MQAALALTCTQYALLLYCCLLPCTLLYSSNSAAIADAALNISIHATTNSTTKTTTSNAWSDLPVVHNDVACDVATAATDAHLNLIATVTQAETASEYSARYDCIV
jgi:hypothetical protein